MQRLYIEGLGAEAMDGSDRGQQVSAVRTQPTRHRVGAAIGIGIQPNAGDATKVGGLAGIGRSDASQIDPADIARTSAEFSPGLERLGGCADAEGAGEVVAAAQRHDQRRDLVCGQRGELAMDSAISARDQCGSGGRLNLSRQEFDVRQAKRLQVLF